ncbi:MAG: ATP-binding cassette domain-containing protein [Acidobacteriota bacterium]|nr:ATP-binding cassette domain-containing protein [Acidobacteriota bacterium]
MHRHGTLVSGGSPRRPATPPALEVSELTHRFGPVLALEDLSFDVGAGEIVGLVGRNGAGKTTTMRAVMGIVRPDRGTVRWRGHAIREDDRLRFGYMPEERGLYPQMRLCAQVAYFARLHGMRAGDAIDAARTWLERLGLGARMEEKLVALSHGNQQRVQLAVALAHAPDLLVLDEPFSGLDPEAVDSLSDVLRERALGGTAILFSSHQLELVERICRRVVIVDAGRLLAAGTLRDLRRRFPAQLRVKVETTSDWTAALTGVRVVGSDEDGALLVVDPGVDPQEVLHAAQEAGPVERFAFESAGLIDLYRRMVSA